MKYPLRRITWIDSHSSRGWLDQSEADDEPATCTTVGYVVKRGKICLVSAHSIHGKQINGCMTIPLRCIKKIERLK